MQSHFHHLADRKTEADHEVLGDQGQEPGQLFFRPGLHRTVHEGNRPGVRRLQAAHQIKQGGLAAAVGAQNTVAAAPVELKSDIAHNLGAVVAEADLGQRPEKVALLFRNRSCHPVAVF